MVSKKDRKHGGYTTPRIHEKFNKQYMIDNCLEPKLFMMIGKIIVMDLGIGLKMVKKLKR